MNRVLWVLLGFIGIFVGTFGTVIGAAGGFVLVPILLFLYPEETPATITSITLTVAFFNALSGSIAYSRLKRIDYRSGLIFSSASVPGSVIGANITTLLSRGLFQSLFGVVIIIVAIYLFVRPQKHKSRIAVIFGKTARRVLDTGDNIYTYSFSIVQGMIIAFAIGLVSGLLGIGGGIIHVPALTQVLGFPAHIATATSHFVVAITTLAAVTAHIVTGAFTTGIRRAAVLSTGAVIGAQLGARLSQKVSGVWIIRLLAIGLASVGIRLLIVPA